MAALSPPAHSAAPVETPLEAALLAEPPNPVQVGAGNVLYLEGRCDPRAERGSLRIALAERLVPVDAERMPEPGSLAPGARWWVLLEIPAEVGEGEHELSLRARLDGREAEASLGTLDLKRIDTSLVPPAPSRVVSGDGPLIAICMATHEPDLERLARQLESIRDQDWPEWVCLISDDNSSPECLEGIQRLAERDERFIVSACDRRLGFYRNFERALRLVPAEAEFVALADQDDVWDADKLSALHASLAPEPRVRMAYSDMRITDGEGRVISDTYWILRSNRWDDIASLLVANTVTGAASLFRASLLDDALPFPPPLGEPYHDHWLALCALASGELAYLPRPTYDRVRHLESVTAETRHAEALRAIGAGRPVPPRRSRRSLSERLASSLGWRAVYFQRYLLLAQFARVLELRLGDRIPAPKRRAIARIGGAERSLRAALWLGARSLRPLIGRDETMARERVLLAGVLWRRIAGLRARLGRAQAP